MVRWDPGEVVETVHMLQVEHLDIRTVTLGISLRDCAGRDGEEVGRRAYEKICRVASGLAPAAARIEVELGIRIANRRIAVTPVSLIGEGCTAAGLVHIARALDAARRETGADFLGGYSALVEKGFTTGKHLFMESLPEAIGGTEGVCASVNVATTAAGINMDAVRLLGGVIKDLARATADRGGVGCAKLVVFANAPSDNPFMAGSFHGVGEAEAVVNVGVSGPGAVRAAVEQAPQADLRELAEIVKRTAFKVTRTGELVGSRIARWIGVPFGIVDLSLAPTPFPGDSVAQILEAMGVDRVGAPGSVAALALLTDSVKKGGAMATSCVGGLSGAFIPVSEDAAMSAAAQEGALTIPMLLAMTAVCSVGLDMVAVPGDTAAETLAGIIADEIAIGTVNGKTTGVRIIPVPGKAAGEWVEFGGLLGAAPILPVSGFSAARFISRGGRIPPPLAGLRN